MLSWYSYCDKLIIVIVLFKVDTSACSEPGWLSGEIKGQAGWFPEAYVEVIDGDSPQPEEDSNYQPPSRTPLPGIDETPENVNSTEEKTSFFEPKPTEPQTEPKSAEPISDSDIKAIAQYPWKAKEENHLSFNKGDVIIIKEQQDMWCFGQIGDASGWFPKSYVRQLDESGNVIADDQYYISLYPFESQEPGDLTFDANELIKVSKKEGDWWTGSITESRQGVFPSNYVRAAQPEEVVSIDLFQFNPIIVCLNY